MASRIRIRMARPEDAAQVARVHSETWREAYPGMVPDRYLVSLTRDRILGQWRGYLQRGRGYEKLLVAESGNRIIGFLGFGPNRLPRLPFHWEIYTLYVEIDWQGRGVGRGLVSRCFGVLCGTPEPSALVWVLSENPARFFYEVMGGRMVSQRKERFAGALLPETAYGWDDLVSWTRERRHAAG